MASLPKPPRPKTRGPYNCSRCHLPKKGHVCPVVPVLAPAEISSSGATSASGAGDRKHRRQIRRALSFDVSSTTPPWPEDEATVDVGACTVPMEVMALVLRRLGPRGVMDAAGVSRGWRDCTGMVWGATEELCLRVPASSSSGLRLLRTLLPRCTALSRLQLQMESDVDTTTLDCIALSCPSLRTLEITMVADAVNRMTGADLNIFVSKTATLSVLKIRGCSKLDILNLCSSSLSILWLSDLCSLSESVLNCPNMNELSLCFTQQRTDLVTLMDGLGRTCPNLKSMIISSYQLSDEAVRALVNANNLSGLCMLSLILGSKITDAAVASIVKSCPGLESLDLSGSSISDNGVGMICKAYRSLSMLRLAGCSNVTTGGIHLATAELPSLQKMDCGMSLCPNLKKGKGPYSGELNGGISTLKGQPICRLTINHKNLKKLGLWGCSAIDALEVNCPELNDLNLNSCTNLHPDHLVLQCPNLKNVHASGCQDMLIGAIRNQRNNAAACYKNKVVKNCDAISTIYSTYHANGDGAQTGAECAQGPPEQATEESPYAPQKRQRTDVLTRPAEILAALEQIPNLAKSELLRSYGKLIVNDRLFQALLDLPMDFRKEWLLTLN